MTPHRLPLDPDPARWPFEAADFLKERTAILAAEPDIRNPEKLAVEHTRRWWAMGSASPSDW
jgi:hypothetical protein